MTISVPNVMQQNIAIFNIALKRRMCLLLNVTEMFFRIFKETLLFSGNADCKEKHFTPQM